MQQTIPRLHGDVLRANHRLVGFNRLVISIEIEWLVDIDVARHWLGWFGSTSIIRLLEVGWYRSWSRFKILSTFISWLVCWSESVWIEIHTYWLIGFVRMDDNQHRLVGCITRWSQQPSSALLSARPSIITLSCDFPAEQWSIRSVCPTLTISIDQHYYLIC